MTDYLVEEGWVQDLAPCKGKKRKLGGSLGDLGSNTSRRQIEAACRNGILHSCGEGWHGTEF